jgi:hypothetical protein
VPELQGPGSRGHHGRRQRWICLGLGRETDGAATNTNLDALLDGVWYRVCAHPVVVVIFRGVEGSGARYLLPSSITVWRVGQWARSFRQWTRTVKLGSDGQNFLRWRGRPLICILCVCIYCRVKLARRSLKLSPLNVPLSKCFQLQEEFS